MRQPGGIGSKVEWHEPADFVESMLGFRRYFTLENRICKTLFDLADDPLRCADGFLSEGCHDGPDKKQSLTMMINRLRKVTGRNFGYDPNAGAEDNEQAISAWEDWFQNSGDY